MMETRKEGEPTMERPPIEDEVEEESDDHKLQHLLQCLEQEWDFIKQLPDRSSTRATKIVGTLSLVDNSPTTLMSSLQHNIKSSPWKVRTNDLAVEEILKERRAAIQSGRLRGRRLFEEEEEVESEVGFGNHSAGFEDREVRSVFSYESDNNIEDENYGHKEEVESLSNPCYCCCCCSSDSDSDSSVCQCAENNVESREGIKLTMSAEKKIVCDEGNARSVKAAMAKIAIVVVVFIVGIIAGKSFCPYEEEDIFILTPT